MLSNLIEQLSHEPFNQELNFQVAVEYERLNQTASAILFYQRVAEYGNGILVYNSLLKMSDCFEKQKDRQATVMQNAMQAVTYMPDRPEAYFRVAQLHDRAGRWQDCYTFAELGLFNEWDWGFEHLPQSIGYHGSYVLEFEKAVAGWWLGRKDESNKIFLSLLKKEIAPEYRRAIIDNLERTGVNLDPINPLEPVITNYRKYYGNKAPIIFDIGTRDGVDADYLANGLKASTVYAIDANPISVQKTISAYPWMKVFECAISDYDGEATFQQVNSGNENMDGCSSLFANKVANEDHFQGKVNVIPTKVKRMDTLLQEENLLGAIDVVKIDTEGYSWQVLQGFGDSLSDVKLLHVETELEPTHDEHRNTDTIADFMESKGFFLVDVSTDGSGGINGGIQDQIWVNPKLATRNTDCF